MTGTGWTRDDLERTSEHVVKVGAPTAEMLARHLPTDFEVPKPQDMAAFRDRVAPLLSSISDEVEARLGPSGPGLAVVVGEGLDALADSQLTVFALGISACLGRPIAQNAEDELIISVRDHKPADPVNARGYMSNGHMQMHTDPADGAGLLCLRPSAAGGESWFSSAAAVHDAIAREAPALLPHYFRPWGWDLRGLQRPGADRLVTTPVFGLLDGKLYCRFGLLMLREGERAMDGLSAEADAALELFDEVAQRPELTVRCALSRGESAWFNNYRILHGRAAFEDGTSPEQGRHLLRTWFWMHERSPLPPGFAAFSHAMDRT